jgi:transcription antitermination factor NusA-like protein
MRGESVGQWLPLIEYSIKSGVSLSTIRRKIKSNSIQFRLEKGKYLIRFEDPMTDTAERPISHSHSESSEEAQDTIQKQGARIRQLEQELNEMALLVQVLENKYGIRY